MSYEIYNTIVAIATPPGEGALGIIRLSGSEAIAIVNRLFPRKNLLSQSSHSLHVGVIQSDEGQIIDEVVVSLFKGPNSYTGEDIVEISCHGSSYIIQRIMEVCLQGGARHAKAGEFTMRAFLNGKMDLSQAEAVADLIASESHGAHELAMKQMRGGFSKEINHLRNELIRFASLIELELDFSEEDVEFANRQELKDLIHELLTYIYRLKDSFSLGNVIKNGVATAIVGRPNAGKSTLLNAILKEDRAIVSEIAGTTRDTIESSIAIGGVKFRLIDTAGVRETEDVIEKIGVERTIKELDSSALLLYLFDVSQMEPADVHADLEQYNLLGKNLIVVANKMDLYPTRPLDIYYYPSYVDKKNLVSLSAINEMNIIHLQDVMVEQALNHSASREDAIVTNSRHYEALSETADHLQKALENMDAGITGDFLAMDIRYALHALGSITGEVTTDDLLDNIFSSFCIGK